MPIASVEDAGESSAPDKGGIDMKRCVNTTRNKKMKKMKKKRMMMQKKLNDRQ